MERDLRQTGGAGNADQVTDADNYLRVLSTVERQAELLCEKLLPFDEPDGLIGFKELSQLREGLVRIASLIGDCTGLATRMVTVEERALEPASSSDSIVSRVLTAEDKMFPVEGYSDDLTGLPGRPIAEKAIESALGLGRPRYAAVFVLDRISHMSNRYSVDVGKQAIRNCAQFLGEHLPKGSFLFRWRGAAFVALFDNSGVSSEGKLLVEQIAIKKQKFNFLTNQRSAMVNLTLSSLTITLIDHTDDASVGHQIDQFIDGHCARQPH